MVAFEMARNLYFFDGPRSQCDLYLLGVIRGAGGDGEEENGEDTFCYKH